MQRALIQYRNPKNYDLVYEALHLAHRTDLIGYDKKCLIRPKKGQEGRRALAGKKSDPQMRGMQKLTSDTSKRPKKKKTIRNVHKRKK